MCYNAGFIQLSRKTDLPKGKSHIRRRNWVFDVLQISAKYSYNFSTLFQIDFYFIVYFYTLEGAGD